MGDLVLKSNIKAIFLFKLLVVDTSQCNNFLSLCVKRNNAIC